MVSFKTKWLDLFIGAASIVIVVATYMMSASFPEPHEAQLGAAVFPRIVSALLVVFGVFIAVTALRRKGEARVRIGNAKQVFLSLAALLLYGIFLKKAGFLILTPFFIAAVLAIIKYSRAIVIALTSILSTAAIYIIFKMLLAVPLPEGLLGF